MHHEQLEDIQKNQPKFNVIEKRYFTSWQWLYNELDSEFHKNNHRLP